MDDDAITPAVARREIYLTCSFLVAFMVSIMVVIYLLVA
jgi:hypothetical protein